MRTTIKVLLCALASAAMLIGAWSCDNGDGGSGSNDTDVDSDSDSDSDGDVDSDADADTDADSDSDTDTDSDSDSDSDADCEGIPWGNSFVVGSTAYNYNITGYADTNGDHVVEQTETDFSLEDMACDGKQSVLLVWGDWCPT